MAIKNVVLKIGAKGVSATTTGLKKVAGGLKSLSTSAVSVTKKIGLLGVGLGAVSVKIAGDFQKSLLEITTLLKKDTGESIKEFTEKNLRSLGKELTSVANTSGLALDSLAKAKYDIVSAGFSNASDSAKVLEEATKLAVGGVTTAAGAADILTSALNAFGEEADQADELSDALFTTVRLGKTTITELGASLGQVLPFAKSFNLTIEDVGSAMATLTAAGINTAESTTALKGAIVALESPSKGARDEMKRLGIEVKRNDDGTVDLINTVKQFAGLDPEVFSKLIPNVRAQLALKTLVNNMTTLADNTKEFEDTSGASETAFQKMVQGFNSQVSILKNNIQTVFIAIGNTLIEKIQPHILALNTEFKKLNEIGFENLANALAEELPLILENVSKAFQIAMINIGGQIDVLGLKFQNLITPFDDMSQQIKDIQAINAETFRQSIDTIGLMFTNMYNNVVTKATEASEGQEVVNDSVKEQSKELDLSNVKYGVLGKTLGKHNILNKKLFDLNIDLEKVTSNGIVSQQELLNVKQQQLEADLKGAILSGQSAKDAMKSVVKAKTMEAITSFVASIFRTIPYPLNLVLAAGAGTKISSLVDEQLAKFADGGIVQGNPSQGDVVPVMATAGELILNQAQQDNLVGGMGGITINIGGNIIGEESFVRDTLIPEIEKARTFA